MKNFSIFCFRDQRGANSENFIKYVVESYFPQRDFSHFGNSVQFAEIRLWQGFCHVRQVLVYQFKEFSVKEFPSKILQVLE